MRELVDFLFTAEFLPSGHSYLSRPGPIWFNVSAGLFIFLAYGSIPLAIFFLHKRRKEVNNLLKELGQPEKYVLSMPLVSI